jgi:lipopolysaccharide/colanic/teichoic acid biosynthesis glycosyltransferase
MHNGQNRSNGHVSAGVIPLAAMAEPDADHPPRTVYGLVKLVFDSGFAFVVLVLTAPLLLLLAALVKLTSRGPAFYAQTRLGRGGRPYTLYKLRTMTCDAERTGAQWAVPGDPRITRIGALLRKTHLDELPQFWNVLRGDMSVVGPRPERPEFVPSLAQAIPQYEERLLVKPGVTGLAQVRLPADTDLDSVRRKLAYDLYYVRHMGIWLDLRIILCTAFKMLGIPFRALAAIFWLPTRPAVEGQAQPAPAARSQDPPLTPSDTEIPQPLVGLFAPELVLEAADRA